MSLHRVFVTLAPSSPGSLLRSSGACRSSVRPCNQRNYDLPYSVAKPNIAARPRRTLRRGFEPTAGDSGQVYIASDYAGVIEAFRSKNVNQAFVLPVCYVVALRA
jgi:hypothetical protein